MKPRIFVWLGTTKGGFEQRLLSLCHGLKNDFDITLIVGLFEKPDNCQYPYKIIKPLVNWEKIRGINNVYIAFRLAHSKFISKYDICIGWFGRKIIPYSVSYVGGDEDLFNQNSRLLTKVVHFFLMIFHRSFLRNSDLLIANSKPAIRYIKKKNLGEYFYSPCVVDINQFQFTDKSPIRRKAYHLLFVGRDAPQKNLNRLIQAVNLIEGKVHLHVVGVKAKNTKNITYYGWKNHEEIDYFYNLCDIYVMPSFQETFGIASIEALSVNKPVLLSKYAGAVDEIGKYVHICGIKTTEIKEAILEMINNYDFEYKRATEGRIFVRNNFDEKTNIKKEIQFILKKYQGHIGKGSN